ncbi:hypothetical protein KIW84_061500 [Lathyrus oleraceus]|uniref:Uncharacterized protein n=1 Tax=Pisum sativum TaxID=3888 RepID=A0A9D5A2F0_PEA|nr:hypothetical protein KIW84_061500 [Pisum sativum]
MFVVDMDAIPKVCPYFMHHTLDMNQSGSDLMLYLLLTRQPVNIGRIISGDMNEIAQSPKKSLGHANVILMLCQKAGVANLDDRQMVKPARPLDPVWLKENTVAREDQNAKVRATRRPQVDTWAAAQRFRDPFAGEPPASHYDRYRYSGIETLIQLGGPIHPQHQQ